MSEAEYVYLNSVDLEAIYHLLEIEKVKIPVPVPNLFFQDVTGMNGKHDYTGFYPELTYSNISIPVNLNSYAYSKTLETQFLQEFNGKVVRLVLSTDSNYYYKGRCTVSESYEENEIWYVSLTIDAYPFKYQVSDDSEVSLNV